MRVKPSGPIYNRAGMPFAWYLMDRPHGTFPGDVGDVADATGRRRAMIRQAGCSYGNGPAGRCLKFDGSSNAYASTPDNLPLSGNPAFTIAFSFFTSSSSARGLFGFGNTSGVATAFGVFYALQGSGVLSVEYANGNSAYVNTSVPVGMWHRAVVTKSPGTINATTRIHVDGIDQGVMNGASSSSTPNITLSPFTLGRFADDIFDATLSGSLDNVQIYDYVWTTGDVRKDIRDPFWRLRRPSRLLVGTPVSVFAQIPDGGFEVPALGAGAYQLNPPLAAGQPWTFVGNAGVSRNGSAFTTGAEPAPEGNQLALIQSVASFSQDLPFASATYSLSFWTRQRSGNNQDFNVLLDSTVIDHVVPDVWAKTTISGLAIAAGTHTLTFQGLNTGDNTCFIDDVQFSPPIVATAYTVTGPSSGFAGVPSANFTITPNAVTSGTVHITATFTGTGAPAPQIFTFASSLTPQTFALTPTAVSADITITFTNDGFLTNQAARHYAAAAGNAYTVTGPASGLSGQASTDFTIIPNGLINTTITATPSGCGLSTPIVKIFSNIATPQVFTLVPPTTAGSVSLVFTNGDSLTNQTALTYLVSSYIAKGIDSIDLNTGWTGNGFKLNGAGASYVGTELHLVASSGSASSFSWLPLPIGGFAIEFTVQLPVTAGRGLALVLQNQGATARGTGALGVIGITPAVALELDTSALTGAGQNTLCLVTTTPSMSQPADLAAHANVHLHGGYPVRVRCRYDGTTLRVWTTDTSTGAIALEEFVIDLPTILGSGAAYIGFTTNATSPVSVSSFSYADLSGAPTPVGIGIVDLTYFDGCFMFANAAYEADGWGQFANESAKLVDEGHLDARGWPMADFSSLIMIYRDNNDAERNIGGRYGIKFTGQATVTCTGTSGTVNSDFVYTALTNTTEGTVTVNSDAQVFYLQFANTKRLPTDSPGTGVTDLFIMRPIAKDSLTFHPYSTLFSTWFIDFLRKFSSIRLLDYALVNFLPITDWADRAQPGVPQAQYNKGGALEYMIMAANEAEVDLWLQPYAKASDDFVVQMLTLLRDGSNINGFVCPPLDPQRKVYIEHSNEIWNPGFAVLDQLHVITDAEIALGGSPLNYDGETNYLIRNARYAARFLLHAGNAVRSLFGDEQMMSRFRPVIMGQSDQRYSYAGLDFLNLYYGKVDSRSDYSGTPYPVKRHIWGAGGSFYASFYNQTESDGVEAMITSGVQDFSAVRAIEVAEAVAFCLHRAHYEGNLTEASDVEPGPNKSAVNIDPRMENLTRDYLFACQRDGCGLLMYFASGYHRSFSINYPNLLTPTPRPKTLGVQDVRAVPAPAVTAGIVGAPTAETIWGFAEGAKATGPSRPNTGDSYWLVLNCLVSGLYTLRCYLGGPSSPTSNGTAQVYVGGVAIGGPVAMVGANSDVIVLGDIPLVAGLNGLQIYSVLGWADPVFMNTRPWFPGSFSLTPTAAVTALAGPTPVATLSAGSIAAGGSATLTVAWSGGNPHGVPVVVTLTPSVGTCTPSTVTLSSDAADNQITTLDIPGGTSANFHTLTLTNTLGLSKSVIGFSVGASDVPTSLSSSDSSILTTSTSTSVIINKTDSFISGERTSKDSNSIGLLTSGPGNIIY